MSEFTVYEKMRCLEREVRLRCANQRTAVRLGKPQNPKFEYQIKVMQEIFDEYKAKWDGVVPVLNVDDGYMV